jgi:hypothetical protein
VVKKRMNCKIYELFTRYLNMWQTKTKLIDLCINIKKNRKRTHMRLEEVEERAIYAPHESQTSSLA